MAKQSQFTESFVAGIITIIGLAALLWLFGVDVTVKQITWMTVAFSGLFMFLNRTADISIGFAVITIALFSVVTKYLLPNVITDAFAIILAPIEMITGIPIGEIDPISLLVISVVAVAIMIALRVRITGEGKRPTRIYELVLQRFARYINTYVTMGRITLLIMVTTFGAIAAEVGMLGGSIGDLLVEAPFVAANMFTGLAGYFSLGGPVPFFDGPVPLIGTLTAFDFLALVALVLIAAAGAKWRGSGPLSQYLREQ